MEITSQWRYMTAVMYQMTETLDFLFNRLFRLTTKIQSFVLMTLYGRNHQWLVDSLHEGPVMWKTIPMLWLIMNPFMSYVGDCVLGTR